MFTHNIKIYTANIDLNRATLNIRRRELQIREIFATLLDDYPDQRSVSISLQVVENLLNKLEGYIAIENVNRQKLVDIRLRKFAHYALFTPVDFEAMRPYSSSPSSSMYSEQSSRSEELSSSSDSELDRAPARPSTPAS